MKRNAKTVLLIATFLLLFSMREWVLATDFNQSEGIGLFVDRMYKTALGRTSDEEGFMYWTDGLCNRTINGATVANCFLFSEEAINKHWSNEEYVSVLYQTLLGRMEDQAGLQYWISQLESGFSRKYICRHFIGSEEFHALCEKHGIECGDMILTDAIDQDIQLTKYIYKQFEDILGRKPDEETLSYWVEQVYQGKMTPQSVTVFYLLSEESKQRNCDNEQFIKLAYRVIAEREVTADAAEYWLAELNNGVARDVLVECLSKTMPAKALGLDTIGYIFLGDSRFYEIEEKTPIGTYNPRYFMVALGGAGYEWVDAVGLGMMYQIINEHPEIRGWCIVSGMGVNDLDNVSLYMQLYNNLIAQGYQLTLLSVNPVDEPNFFCTNAKIEEFNANIQTVNHSVYIDSYTYLVQSGYKTKDTIHYTDEVNSKFLQFVLKRLLF